MKVDKIEFKGYMNLYKSSKCYNCLGCNKLELWYFQGVRKCGNYRKGSYGKKEEYVQVRLKL